MLIEQKFYFPEQISKIISPASELSKSITDKIERAKTLVKEACNLINYPEELALIEDIATKIHFYYNQAIILGIGGAISASRTYTSCYNYQSQKFKLLYSDSISIEKQNIIFTKDNLKNSAIIIISRSGESAETLTQLYNIINKYQQYFGKQYNIGKHFFIITYGQNILANIGKSIDAHIFNYTSKSGKFSAFSIAGLLPAKLIDMQPKEIISGALKVLEQPSNAMDSAWNNFQLTKLGYNINVLSNYNDRFEQTLNWYSQISSEITAKNGKGSTIITTGIFDQHGSWQLFLAGPNDKYFTLFWDKEAKETSESTQLIRETHYKLNKKSLIKKQAPIRELILDKVSNETLGFLMMQLLLESVFLANFLDVPSITHPDIEKHKKILNRIYSSFLKKLY